MAALSPEHLTVLHTIETWPVEEQVSLARLILERAAVSNLTPPEAHQRSTWQAMYGLAANRQAAPTDEQVAQWLDERRMEKYGE